MPTLYLTVGPPGAGKTTFVSWKLVAPGAVAATAVLNPDGLLFVGDQYRWSPARLGLAWRAVRGDFERLLRAGRDLVLDATSVRRRERKPFLKAARAAGYRVVAIFFRVPLDVLLERDREREDPGKRVGPEVITRFVDALEPPEPGEGFDEVWVVGEEGERVQDQ